MILHLDERSCGLDGMVLRAISFEAHALTRSVQRKPRFMHSFAIL